jgi:hypothetical protein
MPVERLSALPPSRRLAVGLFLCLLLGFYAAAQVQLVSAAAEGSGYPGPHEVLVRYHGDPTRSRLHKVLDPSRPPTDAKNMYVHLGPADEDRPAQRARILAWVEQGMPREGWDAVAPVFTGEATCGGCHSEKGIKPDMPLDTWERVVGNAGVDTGMPYPELATSSHNHLAGFAVMALLVSLVFTASRWRGPVVPILVAGAFVGAGLDVASWWLTRAHGSPWHWGVLVGGGSFGSCVMTMVALSLDELWLRGALGGVLEKALAPLGLGRREPV